MVGDEKLQQVALAIFRSVTTDPEATWETMSPEERSDATQWALAAIAELQK